MLHSDQAYDSPPLYERLKAPGCGGDTSGVEVFGSIRILRAARHGRRGDAISKPSGIFRMDGGLGCGTILMAIFGGGSADRPKDNGKDCCRACWIINMRCLQGARTIPIRAWAAKPHFRVGDLQVSEFRELNAVGTIQERAMNLVKGDVPWWLRWR